jgi:hypothetical protein
VEEESCKRRGVNHSGPLPKCQLVIWHASSSSPPASCQDGVTSQQHKHNRDVQDDTLIVIRAQYFDVSNK